MNELISWINITELGDEREILKADFSHNKGRWGHHKVILNLPNPFLVLISYPIFIIIIILNTIFIKSMLFSYDLKRKSNFGCFIFETWLVQYT